MTSKEAKQWIENLIKTMRIETSGPYPDSAYKDEVYVALNMAIKVLKQQPCDDCISRQAVLDKIYDIDGMEALENSNIFAKHYADMIKSLPSVTPKEKTGKWIDADGDNAICGCCNRLNHLYGNYCKHCGAKMVEPQESEDKE